MTATLGRRTPWPTILPARPAARPRRTTASTHSRQASAGRHPLMRLLHRALHPGLEGLFVAPPRVDQVVVSPFNRAEEFEPFEAVRVLDRVGAGGKALLQRLALFGGDSEYVDLDDAHGYILPHARSVPKNVGRNGQVLPRATIDRAGGGKGEGAGQPPALSAGELGDDRPGRLSDEQHAQALRTRTRSLLPSPACLRSGGHVGLRKDSYERRPEILSNA